MRLVSDVSKYELKEIEVTNYHPAVRDNIFDSTNGVSIHGVVALGSFKEPMLVVMIVLSSARLFNELSSTYELMVKTLKPTRRFDQGQI